MKNKPILITGNQESGKSFLAKSIELAFSDCVWIDGRSLKTGSRFLFHDVEKHTDLIIIDDVPPKHLLDLSFNIEGVIYVEKQGLKGFYMSCPKTIVSCDIDIKSVPEVIKKQFKIIHTYISDGIFYREEL